MIKVFKTFKVLISILAIFLILFGFMSVLINHKGNIVINVVESFKTRGEYVSTETIRNDITNKDETIAYYKVVALASYEKDTEKIYNDSYTDKSIGTTGDIYLTTSDPFGLMYTKWMSKKIYIGHSGIVYSADGTEVAEVYGNTSNNKVDTYQNDWFDTKNDAFIILRSKDYINKKEIQNWIDENKGDKYNYLYFLKTKNRYYCTDLVSRCYEETQDNPISNKKIFVTGESMISNYNTFVIYYKEKSNTQGVDYNVYYLSEE